MRGRSLRFRMISLFCLVIGIFLAATYVVVYETFSRQTRAYLDDRLSDSARFLATQLATQPVEVPFSATASPGQYLELIREDGEIFGNAPDLALEIQRTVPLPTQGSTTFRTASMNGSTIRVAIIAFQMGKRRAWLVLGEPLKGVERVEAGFRQRAVSLWAFSLLLTTMIAAWYVSRSLGPLTALSQHARLLTDRASRATQLDLGARLPVLNAKDELGQLALNFNELFIRLDAAAQQLRQFVSDAAHEMRTPLAVLHGETQLLLSQARSLDEYQSTLRTIDCELTTMVRIVEGLFTLSMADAGQLKLHAERLQLDEVFEEACGIASPIARKKEIKIEREDWAEVEFRGDGTLVRQVFLILLENAIKYSGRRTIILVGIHANEETIEVFVHDHGIGIAAQDIPLIFKRFYRAAPESSDEVRSGGLGLAIAEAIMRAHGGDVRCTSTVGQGSVFALRFPRKDPIGFKSPSAHDLDGMLASRTSGKLA